MKNISGSTEGALKQISLPGGKHGSPWVDQIAIFEVQHFGAQMEPESTYVDLRWSESIDLLRVGGKIPQISESFLLVAKGHSVSYQVSDSAGGFI